MKRRKIGIQKKVFLEVGAIIAVCLVGIMAVNSRLLESVYIRNVEISLKSIAQNAEKEKGDCIALLSEYEKKQGVSIDLYDTQDNYIYEGTGNFVSGNKLNIVSRTQNDDGSYFNVVNTDGSSTQYIVYGEDFKDGRHIEITAQKDPIRENAELATRFTGALTVFALLISLAVIFMYSKKFTKPLIRMSEVTSKIAKLDFSDRCAEDRNDEIGALAENINTVSDSLDTALTELRKKNAKLTEDIEKERRIEQMRSDFISSASHELKTPIAIIRGYAEGLKMNIDGENASAAEYCDIIVREADKMNSLVLDMLEQSLYSSGAKEPNCEEFSINGLIEEFLKITTPIFEQKSVKATFEKCEDYTAFADKSQMTTVLSNIVLNACSHASGEKSIVITSVCENEKIKIAVFNTGSHIDDKDKDGIFAPFYRSDKAHSRAEGRFGLGLAIVKSITDNHNCLCGFDNKENGVSFWFTVPMKGNTNEN